MAATLDIVSDGRLELGLGAGWNEEECGDYGIELGTLKERFDRFDEALEAIVGLLTQETTDLKGRYYQLSNARCEPKAVQRPHPPIVIGGTGPKRTLKAAARWAQHWNFPGGNVDDFLRMRETLHRHCADIGRDPSEITTSTHIRLGKDGDPGPLAEQAAAFADAGLDVGIVYLPPPHTPAVLEPVASALASLA
jgi:alkanesulfonate monooxygenase SsuD/methylene tetrahydromethanopterin reductase-like flavin-dependent oxidoreductase (luciferase family)